jgi:hypothetical protein
VSPDPEPEPGGVLQAVAEVDWSAYAMPPSEQWYRPDRVPAAFTLLATASNQEEGQAAYNAVLFAVGNNHAGCLYPAAAPAASLLMRVVREQPGWPRWAALEILIEFLAFDVDREEFVDPSGSVVQTSDVILTTIGTMRGDLEHLSREQSAVPTAKSAQDLLEQLDEEP